MSIHLLDQTVDIFLPVPEITALNKVLELPLPEPTIGVAQLKRPKEIAGLLEVRAHGDNLMYQVLEADDAVLAQLFLHDRVVRQRNALLVYFTVSTLVNKIANSFHGGIAVCYPRLNNAEHFHSSLGQADEDAIVDLEQSEQLEGLSRLGSDLVDTGRDVSVRYRSTWKSTCSPFYPDDEDKLGFGRDIECAFLFRQPRETDFFTLRIAVFFHVRFGALEDDTTLLFVGLDSVMISTGLACDLSSLPENLAINSDPKDGIKKATALT